MGMERTAEGVLLRVFFRHRVVESSKGLLGEGPLPVFSGSLNHCSRPPSDHPSRRGAVGPGRTDPRGVPEMLLF